MVILLPFKQILSYLDTKKERRRWMRRRC